MFHDIPCHTFHSIRMMRFEFSHFLTYKWLLYWYLCNLISMQYFVISIYTPMTGQAFTVQTKKFTKQRVPFQHHVLFISLKHHHKLTRSHVSREISLEQFAYASLQFTMFFTNSALATDWCRILHKEQLMRSSRTVAKSNSVTSKLAECRKNAWELHQAIKEKRTREVCKLYISLKNNL